MCLKLSVSSCILIMIFIPLSCLVLGLYCSVCLKRKRGAGEQFATSRNTYVCILHLFPGVVPLIIYRYRVLCYLLLSSFLTFIQGRWEVDSSSVSLLSLGDSGGWSSLNIPGDSSPDTTSACSDVSLRSDRELTLRFDWRESVRLTVAGQWKW